MLTAMAEASTELGVANLTVGQVVSRSGVSRRTFYEQFADRDACFMAAVEEALNCAARYVLPAYESQGRWRDRMRVCLAAFLSFLEDEPHLGRLLLVETLAAGEMGMRRRQQILAHVRAAVDEGRAEAKAGSHPPPLTADGVLGGVLGVLHSRVIESPAGPSGSLLELTGQLMSMIVLPYLGAAAAQRELRRPVPAKGEVRKPTPANPLRDLDMRLTYRTVRVLLAVTGCPGSSNRAIALAADIHDQGQTSKLLARLEKLKLIENTGVGRARGGPNAWVLTERGAEMQRVVAEQAGVASLP